MAADPFCMNWADGIEGGAVKSSTSPQLLPQQTLSMLLTCPALLKLPAVEERFFFFFKFLGELTLTSSSWSCNWPHRVNDTHAGPHPVQEAAANHPLGHCHGNAKL